jgi:alpha-galactosidase
MKFGLWVDPGMVEARRVAAGEFPQSWLAQRGGKVLECHHPSLAVMTQLCLGNPDVVAWIKRELAGIVDKYGLEWMKWDTSGTVNHACDRADHGHGAHGGAWASYEGMMEVWSFLTERFPRLSGFECDPSLRHCRLNPGPRTLMPGGYRNEFMTGPMVGPYVQGSLATVKTTDSSEIRDLTAGWCSASTLDYSIRQHLMGGIAFGNINGMWSQFLSRAPSGYIEAFKRGLLAFKKYRHLLFADVWHPALGTPDGWSALQYAAEDASESVLFVFRHPGGGQKNVVKPKALDAARTYRVTSLNDRPGRDRTIAGASLVSDGLAFSLPDPWLAKGDGFPGPQYDAQLEFGSDIILMREVAR